MARSFTALLSCLVFLGTLAGVTHGATYMSQLNNTGIAFPQGISGNWQDVYADQANGFFILLTSSGIYRMNYQRTVIESSYEGFTCCNEYDGGQIHADLLGTTDYIYLTMGNTNRRREEARASNGENQLWRFDVRNLTEPTIYNYTSFQNGDGYQIAIDSARSIGFSVSTRSPYVEVVDLLTLTMVTRFNYTQGTYPFFIPELPGGWAILFDSDSQFLYIGVDCESPTPGIVWQWDVSTVTAPVYQQNTVFASDPCWVSGFIEKGDGRAWLYEDDAGWIGGFAKSDLSWGSDYSMSTANYLGAIEYDASTHTVYIIDRGYNGFNTNYPGTVFRSCPLDYGNIVHEVQAWQQKDESSHPLGSFLEASTGILYVVSNADRVTTISISGTDCPQVAPQRSSASQLFSPLTSLRALF